VTCGDVEAGTGGLGEVVGGTVEVVGGNDEDALLGVRIIAVEGTYAGELLEKGADVGIGAGRVAVVSIPNVEANVGVFKFETADQWKEPETITIHGERVALSEANFAVEEVDATGGVMSNEAGPVFVAIEDEKGTLGPFMANCPEHCDSIHLIESVLGIYAEETEVVIPGVFCPELIGGVDASFNAGRKTNTELVNTTSFRGRRASHSEEALGHGTAPDVANANRAHPRVLVEGNEATTKKGADGCPGNMFVGNPLGEGSKGISELAAVVAELGEPATQSITSGAIETTGASKAAGNLDNNVVGDLEGHEVGEITIAFESAVVSGAWVGMLSLEEVVDRVAVGGAGGIEQGSCFVGCDVGHGFLELALEHETVEDFVALLLGRVLAASGKGGSHVAFGLGHKGAEVLLIPSIELLG